MEKFDTLVEAMADLRKRGYTDDYNLHPDGVQCEQKGLNLGPDEFHVDEVHRFEGMTDPDDSSVLFAISSKHGDKGVLVDAYGSYASLSPTMIEKFRIDSGTKP